MPKNLIFKLRHYDTGEGRHTANIKGGFTVSKFKNVISALSIASILTSSSAGLVFASVPSDVIGTEYKDAVQVLSALGIMVGDGGTGLFRPTDEIKRSEVTKVAVALKGLSDVALSSASGSNFLDVANDHWAKGYINVGTTEGLIIGDGDGNFRPNDRVTYAEAVTMLIRALGYEPQAASKGGYPTGYMVTASSNGLTKGVSSSASKAINRGDVAELAKNALTIKLMEQVNYGNSIKYEVVEKTLLSDRLDVDFVEGSVTAIGNTSIDGSSVDKSKIKIDGKLYNIGNADVRNLLGFNVEAYIAKGDSGKRDTLLVAQAAEGQNTVLEISADDLNSVDASSSSKSIKYTVGGKTQKATVLNNATVMYNGKKGDWDDLKMIDSGSIVLLDSEKNGKYNIAFINETVNYVVDEVSSSSHRVSDKYDQGSIVLDPDDGDISYIIDKNNELIEAKDLEEWDVVTLTVSKDGSLIYGTVIQNPIEGKIEETDSESVYIDGKKYKIAASYPHSLKIGDEGTFYLDAEGKIAAYSEDKTAGKNYAYLADMDIEKGLSGKLKFKLFTKDGETLTLNGASRVTVNDTGSLKDSSVINAIGAKGQLITYELNSKGEVYKVKTVASSSEIDEDKFVRNFTEDSVVYNSSSSKLLASAMNVKVAPGTIVFDIPSNASSTDDYAVRDSSFFVDGGKYDISVYDVRENLTAGVIIVTNSDSKASEETSIAVVDKITNAKNDKGEDVERLYAYQDGKSVVLYSTKSGIFTKNGSNKLESGDIIQYKTNSSGEVDGINVLFDMRDSKTEKSVKHSANMTTEYGKIIKKFSDSFNLQVNDGAVNNHAIGKADIYIVETVKSNVKISVGDSSDIQKYDSAKPERVFVRLYKDEVKEIVIVRE